MYSCLKFGIIWKIKLLLLWKTYSWKFYVTLHKNICNVIWLNGCVWELCKCVAAAIFKQSLALFHRSWKLWDQVVDEKIFVYCTWLIKLTFFQSNNCYINNIFKIDIFCAQISPWRRVIIEVAFEFPGFQTKWKYLLKFKKWTIN